MCTHSQMAQPWKMESSPVPHPSVIRLSMKAQLSEEQRTAVPAYPFYTTQNINACASWLMQRDFPDTEASLSSDSYITVFSAIIQGVKIA